MIWRKSPDWWKRRLRYRGKDKASVAAEDEIVVGQHSSGSDKNDSEEEISDSQLFKAAESEDQGLLTPDPVKEVGTRAIQTALDHKA